MKADKESFCALASDSSEARKQRKNTQMTFARLLTMPA